MHVFSAPLQPICDEGWVNNHMTCIKFVDEPLLSWGAARQACQAQGADLAEVKYAAEAMRIENIRALNGE